MPSFFKRFSKAGGTPDDETLSTSGNAVLVTPETVNELNPKVPAEVVEEAEHQDVPVETAQDGVRGAEAITLTWTKASLGVAYIL